MIDYKIYEDNNNLIKEVINYFVADGKTKEKSVMNFCIQKTTTDSRGNKILKYTPETILALCNKLSELNVLICIRSDNSLLGKANYLFINNILSTDEEKFYHYLNSTIFGFEYIYKYYAELVVPIINTNKDGDSQNGTCIIINNAIITARHCLEKAESISIKGISGEELNNSKIYVSKNANLDIAVIELSKTNKPPGYIDEGKILEDVIVMGYPKIAGFTDFLTIEKASISSKGRIDVTTKGQIVSYAKNIFSKTELMLITAKIKGGNSGSPVINQCGSIVGIACQTPGFEGKYDDLGYGIVVPSKEIKTIIEEKNEYEYKIHFVDFV